MYSVYALGDPRTGDIRYIGIAKDVYRRYAQHLNHPHKNDVKNAWMAEIKAAGIVPTLTVLEANVDKSTIYEREKHWIAYYKELGAPLTNIVLPTKRVYTEISLDTLEQALQDYPTKQLVTIKGLASLLNTDTYTICMLLRERSLKGFKVGRVWKFEEADIQNYIARQRALSEGNKEAEPSLAW